MVSQRGGLFLGVAAWATMVVGSAAGRAAEREKGFAKFDAGWETVDLLSAVAAGKLEAQLIPKDSTQCRLLITNKTQQPLNVRLPDALAAVPVLAQFGVPPMNGRNGRRNGGGTGLNPGSATANNPGASQTLGVSTGQGQPGSNPGAMPLFNVGNGNANRRNPGNAGNAFPGGLFSVAPESVGQLRLPCVCLEHGKPTPKPSIPYQVRPLESVTEKAEVREICRMLGSGELDQKTAQAAAWHLANGMSWKELEGKRIQHAVLGWTEPFFTSKQIADAKKAVERAVEGRKTPTKAQPSTTLSMR